MRSHCGIRRLGLHRNAAARGPDFGFVVAEDTFVMYPMHERLGQKRHELIGMAVLLAVVYEAHVGDVIIKSAGGKGVVRASPQATVAQAGLRSLANSLIRRTVSLLYILRNFRASWTGVHIRLCFRH